MKPDDPICLCFHVTRRKVINFIRVEKPSRPSQLSECFGAGTGCGWCRTYLERILQSEIEKREASALAAGADQSDALQCQKETILLDELSPTEYARQRTRYVREGGGTPPPGATPIDDESD